MDLTATEEQRLLRESAERFVRTAYSPDARRKAAGQPDGFSRAVWAEFAELGWLALPLPDAHGGLGGGAVEVGILAEAFGSGLITEPYLSTVVLGAGLVADLGTEQQRATVLPEVAAGRSLLAFAHSERQARFDLADIATRAARDGADWVLDGTKIAVLDAPSADHLIVSARMAGDRRTPEGIALFVVPRQTAGLSLTPYDRLGGGRAASVKLDGVRVPDVVRLGGSDDALPAIERTVDRALAALCSEAVGMMAALLEATAAYTKTREQFGKPLAFNQAVRHRLADMASAVEEGRSMALRAALFADAPHPERIRAISGAKIKIGRGARFVAEQAVQLHGGMGVTEELEIGAYLKRVITFEALFGDVDHHLRRHALASGRLSSRAA
ncbi:acyl-CoA dehydrogenase family protein [Chelatococcus reniformis]|uniref:Acyl-CoA dehydrogenase n=1 Tax=Chelatococcus reniformis TaxID=1494448 RepID=A0A916UIB7_9HYPH|nr:acyl-CoA dehydrogenase [Chelatococcus reniformis]GGC74123.1 acyl-CoA dehydrogenase [Chelatococcus reniformis]